MIAFIAADAYELAPLQRRQTNQPWFFAAKGPGFALARAAAEEAAQHPLTAMVSIGVCGALDPRLQPGDIVVDAHASQPRTATPFTAGAIVSQDRVAVSAAEKQALARQGLAVEMESAAVRKVAQRLNIKFYAVKAVSDTATEPMPLDFNRYRDADGRFDRKRIALAVALRPWVIPRLMHLQKNAQHAAEKLGEFLAHCEF